MIFEHTVDYKFKLPLLKIHYYAPAFDDGVVLVAQKAVGQDYLLHFNRKGNLEFKHDFNEYADSLSMPTDREAVVLRPEEDTIYIFNLKDKKTIKIKHFFFSQISCQAEVYYFCETKLLSILEKGDNEMMRMTLTYYDWLTINQYADSEKPPPAVANFDGDSSQWNPSFQVRKINSHSKYAWCEARHINEFEVRVYEIINKTGVYSVKKVSMVPLRAEYELDRMEAAIIEMWEFKPEVLLLFCVTNKNQRNAVNKETGVVNNTFLWDTARSINTIRESRFVLPQKYQDMQVDIFGTPTLSMFRTFYFQPGKLVASPAYFVQNATENVIKQEQWVCSHTQKYVPLQRSRDTLVEGIFEDNNVQTLQIRSISLMIRRELSLFLLKNMEKQPNDEWEYDILMDIFKMLDYEE